MDTLSGKLLIAMPGIGDPRFTQTVILLCSHGPDHAMGLVLNRPVPDLTLPDLLEQLSIPTGIALPRAPILDGGPVGRDRGFVLHSEDYYSEESTLDVAEGICLTATREILHAIGTGEAPRQCTLALGYAGWGEGQLESEIAENVWLICDADPDLVYSESFADKWQRALARLGIEASRLQSDAGHA